MLHSPVNPDDASLNGEGNSAAITNQAVEDALTAVVSAGVMDQSALGSSATANSVSANPNGSYFPGTVGYKGIATPAKGSSLYSTASTTPASYLHPHLHTHHHQSSAMSSAKRRGRPRGWTDARVRQMLSFLEANYNLFKNDADHFYANLAASLGEDVDDAEAREKLEKMLNHYENARRRNDYNWKWFRALNQVLKNPPIPDEAYGSASRYPEDTESLAEDDDDGMMEGGEKRVKSSSIPADPEALARMGTAGIHAMVTELRNKHHRNKAKFDSRYRILEKNMMKQLEDLRDLHAKYGSAFYQIEDDLVVLEKTLTLLGGAAAHAEQ